VAGRLVGEAPASAGRKVRGGVYGHGGGAAACIKPDREDAERGVRLTTSIWRIATDTPDYTADDVTGEGPRRSGGRWNRVGTAIVYASGSIALACLETLAHLSAGDLPLNRYLVKIDVPDEVWAAASRLDPQRNVGWDAIPAGRASLDAGETWAAGRSSLLLIVPSVIVPEASNILIILLHADVAQMQVTKLRRWTYDSRVRDGA